jgi:hypothetical protein
MFEVRYEEPGEGLLTELAASGRWMDKIDENRPYLASGTMVTVWSESGRRVYFERIR